MRKISLVLFLTLLALFLIIKSTLGSLLLNDFSELVEERTGLIAKIHSPGVSLFPFGLKAEKLEAYSDKESDFFTAESLQIKISPIELLTRHIRFKEIRISGVELISPNKDSSFFKIIRMFTKPPKKDPNKKKIFTASLDRLLIESKESKEKSDSVKLIFPKETILLDSASFEMNNIPGTKHFISKLKSNFFSLKDINKNYYIADNLSMKAKFLKGEIQFFESTATYKDLAELKLDGVMKTVIPGSYNLNLGLKTKPQYLKEIEISGKKNTGEYLSSIGLNLELTEASLSGELKKPVLKGRLNAVLDNKLQVIAYPSCSPKNISFALLMENNTAYFKNINIENFSNNSNLIYKFKDKTSEAFTLESDLDFNTENEFIKGCLKELNLSNLNHLSPFRFNMKGLPKNHSYKGEITKITSSKDSDKLNVNFSLGKDLIESELTSKPKSKSTAQDSLVLNSTYNFKNKVFTLKKIKAKNYKPKILKKELNVFLSETNKDSFDSIFGEETIINANLKEKEGKKKTSTFLDNILNFQGAFSGENLFNQGEDSKLSCKLFENNKNKSTCQYKSNQTTLTLDTNELKNTKKLISLKNQISLKASDKSNILASLNYTGPKDDLLSGDAFISIKEVNLTKIDINQKLLPLDLEYKNGNINFEKLYLSSNDEYLRASGFLNKKKGWGAETSLKLNLLNFLPYFKTLEQLSGPIQGKIKVSGELKKPKIAGMLELTDSIISFPLSKSVIGAENIRTQLLFLNEINKNNIIKIQNLYAKAGRGSISGEGEISNYLDKNKRVSSAALKLSEIDLQPAANLNISLSGDVRLNQARKDPCLVEGEIIIQQAYYENELDLFKLILQAQKTIIGDDISKPLKVKDTDKNPLFNFNLDFKTENQLVIKTDVASIELNGQLKLSGDNIDPRLSGKLEVAKGEFGLQSGQFNITSGTINFVEKNKIENPLLSFVAETEVQNLNGENIIIRVNISGSVNNPKVNFSSDSGLSREELVSLIGVKGNGLTIFKESKSELALSEILNPNSGVSFSQRLSGITGFSKVGIDSTFSDTTGELVPLVTAEKKFSSESNIFLESELTGDFNSSIRADYPLNDKFSFSAGWRSKAVTDDFDEYQGSFGADFIYKKRLPGFSFSDESIREDSREIE